MRIMRSLIIMATALFFIPQAFSQTEAEKAEIIKSISKAKFENDGNYTSWVCRSNKLYELTDGTVFHEFEVSYYPTQNIFLIDFNINSFEREDLHSLNINPDVVNDQKKYKNCSITFDNGFSISTDFFIYRIIQKELLKNPTYSGMHFNFSLFDRKEINYLMTHNIASITINNVVINMKPIFTKIMFSEMINKIGTKVRH